MSVYSDDSRNEAANKKISNLKDGYFSIMFPGSVNNK